MLNRLTLPLTALIFFLAAQAIAGDERETIENWLQEGHAKFESQEATIDELLAFYAEKQLGIPYEGGIIDRPDEERLVITLEGSDCVIYVETTLALALTTLQGGSTFDDFAANMRLLRYRDGTVDGYFSRLHYFSDWLYTNEQKGILILLAQNDMLPTIGPINFMSTNREAYRHLAENDSLTALISEKERYLNQRDIHYIPEDRIAEFEHEFQTGDILSFVSTIDGLDIAHTALIKREGNRVGFYHASTTGQVIVDPLTVAEYTLQRGNVNGIIVARLRY